MKQFLTYISSAWSDDPAVDMEHVRIIAACPFCPHKLCQGLEERASTKVPVPPIPKKCVYQKVQM